MRETEEEQQLTLKTSCAGEMNDYPPITSISTKSDVSNEERSATTNYSQEPFESTVSIASREELVQEETLAVIRSKIAVFFSIILAGIGGTAVTYYLVKQAEQDAFNQEVCATCLGLSNSGMGEDIKKTNHYVLPSFNRLLGRSGKSRNSRLSRHSVSLEVSANQLRL
jgi:hypothetical protein